MYRLVEEHDNHFIGREFSTTKQTSWTSNFEAIRMAPNGFKSQQDLHLFLGDVRTSSVSKKFLLRTALIKFGTAFLSIYARHDSFRSQTLSNASRLSGRCHLSGSLKLVSIRTISGSTIVQTFHQFRLATLGDL